MTLIEIRDKWATRGKNSSLLRKDLDKLGTDGVDGVEDVMDKLDEYNDTERSDFDSAEEYQEARDEVWEEVIAGIEAIL